MRASFTAMWAFITTMFNACNEGAEAIEALAKVANSSAKSLLMEEELTSKAKQAELEAKLAATIKALDTDI